MRQAGGHWPPRSAAQPVNLRHSSEQIFAPAKSAFPPSLAVKPESSLNKRAASDGSHFGERVPPRGQVTFLWRKEK